MSASQITPTNNCAESARKLEDFLSQLSPTSTEETWGDIEIAARTLANGLRVRDGVENNHTNVGKAALPQTLKSLLKAALGGSHIPSDSRTGVVTEILRVAANLCVDHDENRDHVLEAGLPQTVVSLLEGYADLIPAGPLEQPLPLSIAHVKVVRNAIGVLLNSSVGYAPVRTRLTSLEAAVTILKLSIALYPPRSWLSAQLPESTPDAVLESWNLRSGLSNWSWRAISELKDESTQLFNPAILPFLIPSLHAFTPPYPKPDSASPFAKDSPLRKSLLQADFDCLEESCMLLESLSLDIEDIRLSLARGLHFPAEHDGVPCLSSMLFFVETGDYPPLWNENETSEVKNNEKAFDICKSAMIKAIVEVSGEEKNEDVLWDEEDPERPGGEFVCKMVDWIRKYVVEGSCAENRVVEGYERDDMVICATLSLGNLARREKHSTTLLSPPHSIAALLSSPRLLGPASDIRLKHGVIGLLKHLAQSSTQSPQNITALGNAGIVKRLASCGIWKEGSDPMREVVQVAAIGVVKHLCNGSIENTVALVLRSSPSCEPGLNQILDLGLRSDTVHIKSEGARVLVNVIKSLWAFDSTSIPSSSDFNSGDASMNVKDKQRTRSQAMHAVLTKPCAEALARLIGRSGKYPILINEGVVALSLFGMQRQGALLVADAIIATLPTEAGPGAPPQTPAIAFTSSDVGPSTSLSNRTPPRALDMLISVLKNVSMQIGGGHTTSATDFPLEIGVNICTLLGQIGTNNSSEAMTVVKDITRPLLEDFTKAAASQGREGMVGAAAKRALELWA